MPSPAISKKERILTNIVSTLAAIVGDGQNSDYHYTPDRVVRIESQSDFILETTFNTVWYVRDDRETYEPQTAEHWDASMEVIVVGMRKHLQDSDDPLRATTEPRSTIRTRLLRDAQKALLTDSTRAGDADNTDIVEMNGGLLEFRPWVDVELLVRVEYSFEGKNP